MSARYDPNLISKAPTSPSEQETYTEDDKQELRELRHNNIQLQDEVDALKKEVSVESQKARLLIPYASKVFTFCSIYTVFAFCVLFLHGYNSIQFRLAESTINFIAGSNLASVVGLIAIIAGGIFSSK